MKAWPRAPKAASIDVSARYWYNPGLKSRFFLVPGAIAIVMTIIGTLLTALVVAREWERGTMEAIMATPVTMVEFIASKILPYYFLALASMTVCVVIAVAVFELPFRGSLLALYAIASAFLMPAPGLGLFVSSATKNQFVASQVGLIASFLPDLPALGLPLRDFLDARVDTGDHLCGAGSLPDPAAADPVPHRRQLEPVPAQHRDDAGLRLLLLFPLVPRDQAEPRLMVRLRAIIIKEIWSLLRDPKARIVLVLPPLIQLFIFTFATTLDVRNVDIAVLDRSGGSHAAELIQRIDGSPNFREIRYLRSTGELRHAIENQQVIAALVIEEGFDRALTRGEPVQVGLVLDGRRSNASQIVAGYVSRITAEMDADAIPRTEGGAQITNWFNPTLDFVWFTLPSLIVVIVSISGTRNHRPDRFARARDGDFRPAARSARCGYTKSLSARSSRPSSSARSTVHCTLSRGSSCSAYPSPGLWCCSSSRSAFTCSR